MNARDRTCHLCGEEARIYDRLGGWCETHWNEAEANRRTEEARVTAEAGGPWPQTCPRRGAIGPWDHAAENEDHWDIREQFHMGLRARHCSFCGSLHPDDFMRLVREGWEIGSADKNYKTYVGTHDNPQQTKFYYWHLSAEQKREFVEIYNSRQIHFAYGDGFSVLPFFMRTAQPSRKRGAR